MLDLSFISRAVRASLVFVILSVLCVMFGVWLTGVLDIYPLLVGIYLMTVTSVVPYAAITVARAVRNRENGKWIITVALALALTISLAAAAVKLCALRSAIPQVALLQLRFDGILALSLALLALSAVIYLGSAIQDGRRLARKLYFSIVEGREDDREVEVI
ncbi:MAG: hypothetical protein LM577_04750 [Thermoproteaceae archaeon]|jgi:hypothetical protein|nr:hypothetical protein [Thermoproteaceae archaeon]